MMNILGVRLDDLTFPQAVEKGVRLLQDPNPSMLFFLNLDCLYRADSDKEYKAYLNGASLVLPDGIGLKGAARLCGERVKDNCNGTDYCPALMAEAAKKGCRIYLLGGRPGVADEAAANIVKQIPALKVVGTHAGYFEPDENVIEAINRSEADILLVAMGVPLQEKWIGRNRAALKPRLCIGVGALFDFWSGRVPRAPLWMRRCKIEWVWRTFVEPKRLGQRYLFDLLFLWKILCLRLTGCDIKRG